MHPDSSWPDRNQLTGRLRGLFVIVMLAISIASCDQIQEQIQRDQNDCPSQIVAQPSPGSSGIQWSVGKVSANITSVVIECIPHRFPATDKGAATTEYEIASTAKINFVLDKDEYPTYEALVVFEAMTENGVVLKSNASSFRLIRGGSSGTASAVIHGFSREEIARVRRLTVRWEYGR